MDFMDPLIVACLAAAALFLGLSLRRKSRLPLPPGPTLWSGPWPEADIAKSCQNWTKKYGPVVSVKIGFKTFIILGTRQAAQDLLERKATIYSSRPPSPFLDNYLHKGLASAFMPYGSQWRLHRRLHASFLNVQATNAYRYLQGIESKKLMHDFLSTDDFQDAFYRYTSDIMFTLVYGKGKGKDDDDHKRLHQINEMALFVLQKASYGMILLDLFPFLDLFPKFVLKWRRLAEELHQKTKQVYVECTKTALQGNCWNWSQAAQQRGEAKELPWDEVCYGIGELYVAGIHTTKMSLENFLVAGIVHGDVIRRAREELDLVVGRERLPEFEDMDSLPYMKAVVSETLRWRTLSAIGVPHAATQDDEYMGYSIPAGATVIANQFGMNMDENVFEDPATFNPDRFLQNPELTVSAFGFGRRLCPGFRIAQSSLFIVIARLVWGFDIMPAEPEKPVDNTTSPYSIKTSIRVRSPAHQRVIEREWDAAEKDESKILDVIREKVQGPKSG